MIDDERPLAASAPKAVFVPPDLARWSVAELEAYIITLHGEIDRVQDVIARKTDHRAAADRLFRSS